MMQQIDSIEFDLLRNTDGIQILSNVVNEAKFQNKGTESVLDELFHCYVGSMEVNKTLEQLT